MPLSIFQIPLTKKILQAEFHPRNNSIFILYSSGDLHSISSEGMESRIISLDCEPVSFRINAAGDLMAILGKGKLFFYSLLTLKISSMDIDEKIQLLEFYKDSVLLSGFQKNIILMKQNGSILKNIEFESLIRQFSPVPATDSLIIYNQDRRLLCADMDGKILWHIENLIIHKEIQISRNGYTGYLILDPNDLLQFDVTGESFFEVGDELRIKSFSISWDGNRLLVLNSENELVMLDKAGLILWEYGLGHDINRIRLSPGGNFFFTIDNDNVLSLYSADSVEKEREEFFEITDNKRIHDKEAAWVIRPGGYNDAAGPNLLTVSQDGTVFGLTGVDGCIYFYDESGKIRYQTSFTSTLKDLGISDNALYGYIYGGNEITIVDFESDKKKYILFEKSVKGGPIINYHHRKIFTLSREKELLIYDFDGHLIKTVFLNKEYQNGISSEPHGIILLNEQEVTGYSASGKVFLNFPVEMGIADICYLDSLLIASAEDNAILRMDLSTLKGKKTSIKVKEGNSEIVSADPLLIVTGDKILYHVDSSLSIISACRIDSPDSHFYMEDGMLYEIVKNYNGFYCYNDKREMIWRYAQEDRIIESALMRNGLVFSTGNSVLYLRLERKKLL